MPQAAHWHDVDFLGPPRFTVTLNAEEGVLALEGHLPGGRALGALCAEKPFLTSAIMEPRVRKSGAFLCAFPEWTPPTSASLFMSHLAAHAP